jgi:hypothetical protein
MKLVHLYIRVLSLLGPEARLGWLLAVGNIVLAGVQLAASSTPSPARSRKARSGWHGLSFSSPPGS